MPITTSRARRLGGLAGTAAILAAVSTTAFAIPAREGAVSAAAPVYAWDGGPGNGSGQGVGAVRCTPAVYECEDTLVEVKDAGDLFAEIKGGEGANDLDVAIYKSDAQGTTNSQPNADAPDAEDVSEGKDSKTTLKKAQPGFYVVRVRIFDGTAATWKGSVTLKPPVAAAPAPAPAPPAAAPAPAPSSSPQQSPPAATKPAAKERRNACKKKAKKIKNKRKRAKAMKRCKKIR